MINIKQTFQDIATDERFIQDLRDVAVSKVFYEDTSNFFTIVPGIKGKQQVAAMRGIEYITRKDEGCGGTSLSPKFPAISQFWEPQLASVKIKYCYKDFLNKFTQWGLANGYNIHKLDEADFFVFLQDLFVEAMKLDLQRLVTLGDKDIATHNILSDANKAAHYDVVNKGLLPTLQYFKTIADLQDNFVDISKNTGTDRLTLTAAYAKGILEEVVDVDDFDGDFLLTNKRLAKNYKDYFKNGFELQSSKDEIQRGIPTLAVDGEMLTVHKNYDRWRKADFTTNGEVYLPHFALFTKKEYLQVGVDDINALENLELEYIGGDDEHFYIKGNYMVDFKMTNPYEFKAAI